MVGAERLRAGDNWTKEKKGRDEGSARLMTQQATRAQDAHHCNGVVHYFVLEKMH